MDPTLVWKWPADKDEEACAVCNKITANRCTRCKTVHYCTKEHQMLHWKSGHKENCGVIELVEDPALGRIYVAKRKIKRGEVVLKEKQMLVTFANQQSDNPICLNCYNDVDEQDNQRTCSKCGWWPICSKCTQHDGVECEFTVKHGKFQNLEDKGMSIREHWNEDNFLFLGVVKVLALREQKPRIYSKILKCDAAESKWELAESTVDKSTWNLMTKCYNLENIEESEISKITRILFVNGVEYRHGVSGIPEKTIHIKHSCYSNCSFTISNKNKGSVTIWAVKEIAPGEHVSVNYYDPTDGAIIRKERLLKSRFANCNCERCEDPSEFGTMFNAIKCNVKECEGYMLPESFAVSDGKHFDFVCDVCKAESLWDDVVAMHHDIEDSLYAVEDADVDGFRNFIEDFQEILHPNHFLIFKAKLLLANVIGFDVFYESEKPNVSSEDLNEKIRLSEELVPLLDILMPAYTIGKGRLLHGLAVSLSRKMKETEDQEELRTLLEKTRKSLVEACRLLCWEDEDSPDGVEVKRCFNLLLVLILSKKRSQSVEQKKTTN